jgi:hypothetical protein
MIPYKIEESSTKKSASATKAKKKNIHKGSLKEEASSCSYHTLAGVL